MNISSTSTADRVRAIADGLKDELGPLLPILHAVQAALGYVPREALPVIADVLNLTQAEVFGVVTFYHDFHLTPPTTHVVRLCGAEACQSMGARRLLARTEEHLGISVGQSTPDGRVRLEAVYCLGLCATAPAALVDQQPRGRLDERSIDAIVEAVRR